MLGADDLRARGIQPTAQRLSVLRSVAGRPHASADEVLTAATADLGAISRQAVYDALELLVAAGLVRRIQPTGSPARFEARDGDNHHHVVCRTCGALADVDCAVGQTPCLTAEDDHGYAIDEAEVVYWGTCPACRESGRAATPLDPPLRRLGSASAS